MTLLLGVDGRSGAGKTSLAMETAALLRPHLSVSVFHLDAVYPGWDGLAQAVQDLPRLVLEPISRGLSARWHWWDWTADRPGRADSTEPSDVVILEGVGAGSRAARALLDAVVWVDLDASERRRRALDRDGETFAPHWERWARQERDYLEQDPVADHAQLTVHAGTAGTGDASHTAADLLECLRRLPGWDAALALVPRPTPRHLVWQSATTEATAQQLFAAAGGPEAALAVLLESSDHAVSPDPARSRHSIFGLSAPDRCGQTGTLSMEHRDGVTTVRQGSVTVRQEQPFFGWLAGAWPDDVPSSSGQVPFQPGWLGWMGHELKRETGSPDGSATLGGAMRATRDLPDAVFFRPDRGGTLDHRTGAVSLFWPADDAQGEAWAQTVLAAVGNPAVPEPTGWEAPTFRLRDRREDYLEKVRAAQEQIRDGNSYEVCLTTQLEGELDAPFPGWQVYRRLVAANPAPFTLYARVGLNGLHAEPGRTALEAEVLSSSPERFLRIEADGTLVTEPIKGTRPRGSTPEQDRALAEELAASEKDRAENIMITDLARNDLSRFAVPGSLATTRLCAIESYPTVHQMVSTVTARLQPGVPRADAVAAAFPPGSMTGAPKISTMDTLEELEAGPRGPYSGVAGYLSADGAADLNVLIRTLVAVREPDAEEGAQRTRLSLGVGGAITSDSVPEDEWDEVRTKARGVLGVLGSAFPA